MRTHSFLFDVFGKERQVSLFVDETGKTFARESRKLQKISVTFYGKTLALLQMGNQRFLFDAQKTREGLRLVREGDLLLVKKPRAPTSKDFAGTTEGASIVLKSQIPGLIVTVNAKENEFVREGQILLLIEAMKMQNPLKAPRSGKITRVLVRAGMPVESGVPLLEIEGLKS